MSSTARRSTSCTPGTTGRGGDDQNDGRGRDLAGSCSTTGYLGYAYMETPGNPTNALDDDRDGMTDERRDGGPGTLVEGEEAILAWVTGAYDLDPVRGGVWSRGAAPGLPRGALVDR
jgi:hypothetical protein